MSITRVGFGWSRIGLLSAAIMHVGALVAGTSAQQSIDHNFDATVASPTYTAKRPVVLFDHAHANFHKATNRYKPFVDLVKSDGVKLSINKQKFSPSELDGVDVLVIVNPRSDAAANLSPRDARAGEPAFTGEELTHVSEWVKRGGALLLVADHASFAKAAQELAQLFQVEMRASLTHDSVHFEPQLDSKSALVFSRDNGLLADHAITRGRDQSERISRVVTFSGQSMAILGKGDSLLNLSDTAVDLFADAGEDAITAGKRSQGVAINYGAGRVVVLGEAGMLSAQVYRNRDGDEFLFGMNLRGCDNKQFALNIIHWLTGDLN